MPFASRAVVVGRTRWREVVGSGVIMADDEEELELVVDVELDVVIAVVILWAYKFYHTIILITTIRTLIV